LAQIHADKIPVLEWISENPRDQREKEKKKISDILIKN